MPTLLLEIGCEELPAGAVPRGGGSAARAGERELGSGAHARLRRAAAARADRRRASRSRRRTSGSRARPSRSPTRRRPASPRSMASVPRISSFATASSGSSGLGSRCGTCFRSGWRRSCAAFPSPSRCAGTTAASASRDRCAGAWRSSTGRQSSGGRASGTASRRARSRSTDAQRYADRLREADVEPDAAERRRQIVAGLDAIGGWSDPAGVLEEVVYLVEKVLVLEGSFDERFLQLPERVIVTAMQSHQRYFPLGGNRFAFVANGGEPDTGARREPERARGPARRRELHVRARCRGAASTSSPSSSARSRSSRAQARSPTRPSRLRALVGKLGGGEASSEAARLAKADQASELVREFPDLEGHIGAEYARLAGYPEAVSAAIEEQYLPDSAGGPLPQTEAGKVLAAADKLDTLETSFSLGHKPSGSRDPYGLRRAAIGLNRLAIEGGLTIPRSLLDDEVREFVEERLEGLLDVPVEYVRAAQASAARGPRERRPAGRDASRRARHAGIRRRLHRLRPRSPAGGKERRRRGVRARPLAPARGGGAGAGAKGWRGSPSTATHARRSSRARRWRR